MTVVIAQAKKIDRMRITVRLNPDQYKIALSFLHGIADVAGATAIKHRKVKYGSRLMLKNGLQSIATVHVGITKQKYRYFCWELWPDAIVRPEHAMAWEHFQCLFNTLAGSHDPIYSLDYALDAGKVSYIEIARDFVGVEKDSILPWTSHARKGDIYKDHKLGIQGATYIGSKGSPRQFCLYDKRLQLIAKCLPCPHTSLLRIEARLRNPGILARDIAQLQDPFQALRVASASKAQTIIKDKQWQAFLQNASNNGVSSGLSELSKHHRKIYRERLTECAVQWWRNP